jgi:hypothetical protein
MDTGEDVLVPVVGAEGVSTNEARVHRPSISEGTLGTILTLVRECERGGATVDGAGGVPDPGAAWKGL